MLAGTGLNVRFRAADSQGKHIDMENGHKVEGYDKSLPYPEYYAERGEPVTFANNTEHPVVIIVPIARGTAEGELEPFGMSIFDEGGFFYLAKGTTVTATVSRTTANGIYRYCAYAVRPGGADEFLQGDSTPKVMIGPPR